MGYCKSTIGAVHPFERLSKRHSPAPDDLVFKADHKKQFSVVLDELGMKFDREGNRRSYYSLLIPTYAFGFLKAQTFIKLPKTAPLALK